MTKEEMFDSIAKIIEKYEEENETEIGVDILIPGDDILLEEGIMNRNDNYTYNGEKFVWTEAKLS